MSIFSRSVQNWESFFVFRLFICDYDILAAAFVEVAPHAERRRALLRYRYLVCRKGNSSAAAIRLRGKTAVYNGVSACVESKRSILFIHYNHSRREIERIGKARSAGAGIHFYSVGRRDFIFSFCVTCIAPFAKCPPTSSSIMRLSSTKSARTGLSDASHKLSPRFPLFSLDAMLSVLSLKFRPICFNLFPPEIFCVHIGKCKIFSVDCLPIKRAEIHD